MSSSTVGLGVSAAIKDVENDIALAARSDARVLISGETGVGKGTIARLIHQSGPRSGASLVSVDCARAPESVLGAELFGQVPGGVRRSEEDRRAGAFEAADRGTVLLTEVGGMSLNVQARLLRFIETGEIRPIGSDRPLPPLDVRVIASTRSPLVDRVAANRFHEELFYRLNAVHIAVPPLRERREDVVPLFSECLRQFAGRVGTSPPELTDEAWKRLTDYSWPRNLRELREVAERLLQRCRGGRVGVHDLPEEIALHGGSPRGADGSRLSPIQRALLEGSIDDRVSIRCEGPGALRVRDFARDSLRQLGRGGLEYARVH